MSCFHPTFDRGGISIPPQRSSRMHLLHVYFLLAFIASAFSLPDLLSDDLSLAESGSNIFLDAAADNGIYPTDPILDDIALPDSPTFLADTPTDCLSAFPISLRSRFRARANICNNVDRMDGSAPAKAVLTTAEQVENHWCADTQVEGFGNVPVCHPETGDKVSSEHLVNNLQGYDFSQAHFQTLFHCTLSKLFIFFFSIFFIFFIFFISFFVSFSAT
jgi:hypothetical protein